MSNIKYKYEKKWSEEEGLKKGEERANKLTELLLDDGRYEDLRKALKEEEFRHKLMKEYGIIQ